jgi:hypothetical protein
MGTKAKESFCSHFLVFVSLASPLLALPIRFWSGLDWSGITLPCLSLSLSRLPLPCLPVLHLAYPFLSVSWCAMRLPLFAFAFAFPSPCLSFE